MLKLGAPKGRLWLPSVARISTRAKTRPVTWQVPVIGQDEDIFLCAGAEVALKQQKGPQQRGGLFDLVAEEGLEPPTRGL